MAIHDYVIDNQSAVSFRSDLNSALQAIVSHNSNATEPTTMYGNMIWYDTSTNILKKRTELNNAWISLGTVDEGAGTFTPTGERALSSQAQAEAGTDNTTVMTPLRVKEAIDAQAVLQFSTLTVTTSGSFVDFSVPSTAREVYVSYISHRTSGLPLVQLLVSGSPITSGYESSSGTSGAETSRTDGFVVYSDSSTRIFRGIMSLLRLDGSTWSESHSVTCGGADANGGGQLTGAGTVTGVRVMTTPGGSFLAGSVSVAWR